MDIKKKPLQRRKVRRRRVNPKKTISSKPSSKFRAPSSRKSKPPSDTKGFVMLKRIGRHVVAFPIDRYKPTTEEKPKADGKPKEDSKRVEGLSQSLRDSYGL